ncbi:hypothetical protein [Ramlibacter montanisoli]|uniref:Uncharacterized protein n=1 Tax=Ramlibacter montanisoli TaxID=2732512 RepID=A0A849K5E8_9BURK|nr:hypothetical protein [Ramlibacter montanisoli]NNU43642.1 hypothetical protein [Ramlibacter montanisoli]
MSSRTYLTVAAPSGNVARLSLRIDFHTDPVCATSPAGYLSFDDPANRVVFDGPGTVQGKAVQRVTYAVAAPAGGVRVPGDRVEFGGAIRLRALAMLFSPIDFRSLWLVENGKLYEGTSVMGPDGYPSDMNMSVGADFVASVPPMVAACAATAVNWGTDSCGGSLPAAVSGTSRLLADINGPATGSATYTCQSGTWTRGASTCSAAPAPVVAPADCSTSPVTWTVNGLSCSGEALAAAEFASSLVANTDPTRRGFAQFTCTAGQQVATTAECGLPLPLPRFDRSGHDRRREELHRVPLGPRRGKQRQWREFPGDRRPLPHQPGRGRRTGKPGEAGKRGYLRQRADAGQSADHGCRAGDRDSLDPPALTMVRRTRGGEPAGEPRLGALRKAPAGATQAPRRPGFPPARE